MNARPIVNFMVALIIAWGAHAQPSIPDPFFQGTFEEAAEHARENYRLHLVFLDSGDQRQQGAARRLWSNRTLGQWIQWHAVLSRVSLHEQPELFEAFEVPLQEKGWYPRARLVVVILRDGKNEGIVPWFWERPGLRPWDPEPERKQIKGPEVLFQANMALEQLAAKNPAWFAHHERLNPPPPAPPRVWFSRIEDANASICNGPEEGQSVLSMLVEARAQVSRGELHEATGTYTWLWEHMDDNRPWLKTLRRTIVAAEMADLAFKRTGSRARFVAIRDDHVARDAWADLPEQLDRYIMDEVVGEIEQSVMELAYAILDEDEGSLIPYHQRAGLELIIASSPVLGRSSDTTEQERRIASLRKPIGRPKQSLATDEEWSHLVELRRQLLVLEVCRLHIEHLRKRSDTQAMRTAEVIVDPDTDGSARLALAAMAWATGLADTRHIAWTKEAIALGADDAGLLHLLESPAPALPSP
ncbi:MAG: hypothetical protein KIT19_05245 [Phycisphaeraceae bacterium]|nr:hypothetical protein [Phycisphaeraceae bacterium]